MFNLQAVLAVILCSEINMRQGSIYVFFFMNNVTHSVGQLAESLELMV